MHKASLLSPSFSKIKPNHSFSNSGVSFSITLLIYYFKNMLHVPPKCSIYVVHHYYCYYSFANFYPLLLLWLLPRYNERCSVCCEKLASPESGLKFPGKSYWNTAHFEMPHWISLITISSSYLELSWLPTALLSNVFNSASYAVIHVTVYLYIIVFLKTLSADINTILWAFEEQEQFFIFVPRAVLPTQYSCSFPIAHVCQGLPIFVPPELDHCNALAWTTGDCSCFQMSL